MWYYFGTFPLYFLFANVLLVPLATLLMILVVALWLFAPISFLQQVIAWAAACMLALMNWLVEFFASLPVASFMLPRVDVAGACFAALLLFLLFYGAINRKYMLPILVVLSAVVVLLLNIFVSGNGEKKDSLLFFNNAKSGVVLLLPAGGGAYVVSSVPQFDSDADRVFEPYVKREGLEPVQWLSPMHADDYAAYSNGLISFAGLRVQMLADDCWAGDTLQHPVDVVWLCRGFLGSVERLLEVYPASCVILDGSLYEGSRRRLLRECSAAGVGCIDISQLGAVMVKGSDGSFSVETMRGK